MGRVVARAVSDIINNHLQDPRIEGIISVTEVSMTPDLKNAHVYLSVLGKDGVEKKTFSAIEHAAGYIQALFGQQLTSKFCPHLSFHIDDRLKRSAETMKIIDEVAPAPQHREEQTDENDIGGEIK